MDGARGRGATVLPEVGCVSIAHDPLADNRGDEEQHQHCDVEDDDAQQQEEHSGGKLRSAEFLQPKGMVVPDPQSGLRHKQLGAFARLLASPKRAALLGCARQARGQREAPGVPL